MSMCGLCQNNARLYSSNGKVFRVVINEKVYNKSLQAEVLLEGIKKDTLRLKVETEEGQRYGATIYLLNQGKPCAKKEFNYRVDFNNNRVKLTYTGMQEIIALPVPLVPKVVKKDTALIQKKEREAKLKAKECKEITPEKQLIDLITLLGEQIDDQPRLAIVKKESAKSCFTLLQVMQILKTFFHDREKAEAATILYFRCSETEAYSSVAEVFSYDLTAKELETFIKSQKQQ